MIGDRHTRVRASNRAHWLVRCVLTLALLVAALTPQGYMPATDEAGAPTFVICTPEGLVERTMPGILDPVRDALPQEQVSGPVCPFALMPDQAVMPWFGGLPAVAPVSSVTSPAISPACARAPVAGGLLERPAAGRHRRQAAVGRSRPS